MTDAATSTASSIAVASDLLGRVASVDLAGKRLVVLGQTVEVSATTVFDDATLSGGLAALGVGDVVEVYALFDAATGHYRATRIERKGAVAAFRLRGPVSNLDTVAKTFNIGAERISYLGLTAPAAATPVNGAFLRVRLQPTPVGGVWLVAALSDGVQRPRDLDDVRLEGLVSAFTSTAQFSVNGVAVDAHAITAPAGLALGARVEVEGTASGGVLVASKVKVKSADEVDRQEFELRDRITSVNLPAQTFVIRGVTVSYSLVAPATDFRNGTVAHLAAGAGVEVRGVLSPDGSRLLAARITFR